MNHLFFTATQFFPNYTLAIIAMTLFLRLVLFPLQFLSAKAARKMKDIQPELSSIKEKCKNDSQKLREETMQLFKHKSINPLMSFIPALLQLPLFYIFYQLLTTFPGPVGTHLASADPNFVLPVIAGVLQFMMMHFYNQEKTESSMAKRMKILMPVIFTGIMIKLPVAVLIYTITSSVYSLVEKGIFSRLIG